MMMLCCFCAGRGLMEMHDNDAAGPWIAPVRPSARNIAIDYCCPLSIVLSKFLLFTERDHYTNHRGPHEVAHLSCRFYDSWCCGSSTPGIPLAQKATAAVDSSPYSRHTGTSKQEQPTATASTKRLKHVRQRTESSTTSATL